MKVAYTYTQQTHNNPKLNNKKKMLLIFTLVIIP